MPVTSFSEFNRVAGGNVWFALDESRPLICFAGIKVEGWTSVRKTKEGEVSADLYAFLTTDPNAEVGLIHPKAMPAILTTAEEADVWLRAPCSEACALQRPLRDGALRIVARGEKQDIGLTLDVAEAFAADAADEARYSLLAATTDEDEGRVIAQWGPERTDLADLPNDLIRSA